MKKMIIGIIMGVLLMSSISAFAITYFYKSEDVTYNPSDENWNVDNVKSAIDELYSRSGNIILDNAEKLTAGVAYTGDWFSVQELSDIMYNNVNINYDKIVLCHKAAGYNNDFTATLPFDITDKEISVTLFNDVSNHGWNPVIRKHTGNSFILDLNAGQSEDYEYYFIIWIK